MSLSEIIKKYSFPIYGIVIIIFATGMSYPQQQGNNDVLPLSVGNKWLYGFEANSFSSMPHAYSDQSGKIEVEILNKETTANGILWHFIQRRNGSSNVYGIGIIIIKDSAKFDLVEVNNLNHEIYSKSFDELSVFPFMQSSVDSLKFFRYKDNVLTSDIPLSITYPDPGNPSFPDMRYFYSYTLRKDVGITLLNFSKSDMMGGSSSKYYLQKFNQTIISDVNTDQANNLTFQLMQNYPNPFNSSTKIKFSVAAKSQVIIKIFDINGKEVSILVNGVLNPSQYEVEFDGRNLASGVYFYQMQVGNYIQSKKLILLK